MEALQEFKRQVDELEEKYHKKPEGENLFPSGTIITFKVLDSLSRFIEIRPKWNWRDLGRAIATVLKGSFDEKDLDMAALITLEIVAMTKGSRSGFKMPAQFSFSNEFDANDFEAFADTLARSISLNLRVERIGNTVKVTLNDQKKVKI